MRVVFVSDFGPFPAMENDPYTNALRELGRTLPAPGAIIVMSGHWETRWPALITSAAKPGILHDYSGFPQEFYSLDYPCPGDPVLARRLAERLTALGVPAATDPARPLDHGAWVPLSRMYPAADIPVLQITAPQTPQESFRIGQLLSEELAAENVLLAGSGALSHNLRLVFSHRKDDAPDPWALQFDAWWTDKLRNGQTDALLNFAALAPSADLAVPTLDHINPFFFSLGAARGAVPAFFHESIRFGNGLMKILVF